MGLIGTQIGNSDNTTTAQIRAAVLTTTITNGDTTHAPDGNAVYDALQLKGDSQTAATQVARLALTGLTRGARVYQTDNGFWYELTNAAAPSDAASWQAQPKVYKATLTQTGTDAPVATVQENGLGQTMTWGYSSTGIYTVTAGAAAFTANQTRIFIGQSQQSLVFMKAFWTSTTVVTVATEEEGGGSNEWLAQTAFTIEVYPA